MRQQITVNYLEMGQHVHGILTSGQGFYPVKTGEGLENTLYSLKIEEHLSLDEKRVWLSLFLDGDLIGKGFQSEEWNEETGEYEEVEYQPLIFDSSNIPYFPDSPEELFRSLDFQISRLERIIRVSKLLTQIDYEEENTVFNFFEDCKKKIDNINFLLAGKEV